MLLTTISIGNSFQKGLNGFFGYLPNILGFFAILLVGYIIARVVKAIIIAVLHKIKVDQHFERSSAGVIVDKVSPGGKVSRLIGALAFWLIFLYAVTAAVGALDIPSVTAFMNSVMAYLPNVIVAVLIFVVAAVLSGTVVGAVKRTMGGTPTGKIAETVIPGLVMAIAVFMILTQLQIAPAIVTITYGALIGMLALTGALAFGLGGRDVAGQIWSNTYQKGQQASEQAREDLRKGQQRAGEIVSSAPSGSSGSRTVAQPIGGDVYNRPVA